MISKKTFSYSIFLQLTDALAGYIEKFDRENITGQHLRPPALAIATTGNC